MGGGNTKKQDIMTEAEMRKKIKKIFPGLEKKLKAKENLGRFVLKTSKMSLELGLLCSGGLLLDPRNNSCEIKTTGSISRLVCYDIFSGGIHSTDRDIEIWNLLQKCDASDKIFIGDEEVNKHFDSGLIGLEDRPLITFYKMSVLLGRPIDMSCSEFVEPSEKIKSLRVLVKEGLKDLSLCRQDNIQRLVKVGLELDISDETPVILFGQLRKFYGLRR